MRFEQPAQEAAILEAKAKVEHAAARFVRLEQARDQTLQLAPRPCRRC